ncbi:hypothetical protein BH10PLA2_BH10PLA2_39680 [soil metagenome]
MEKGPAAPRFLNPARPYMAQEGMVHVEMMPIWHLIGYIVLL